MITICDVNKKLANEVEEKVHLHFIAVGESEGDCVVYVLETNLNTFKTRRVCNFHVCDFLQAVGKTFNKRFDTTSILNRSFRYLSVTMNWEMQEQRDSEGGRSILCNIHDYALPIERKHVKDNILIQQQEEEYGCYGFEYAVHKAIANFYCTKTDVNDLEYNETLLDIVENLLGEIDLARLLIHVQKDYNVQLNKHKVYSYIY